MKNLLRISLAIIAGIAALAPACSAPNLTAAAANSAVVPAYSLFELTPNLTTAYSNPFDPAQIDVGADFTSPHGVVTHVNGFVYQEYATTPGANGAQLLTKSGDPVWKIRFAPNEPGKWSYVVTAADPVGTVRLKPASFRVTPSGNPGFVRVNRANPRAFAFDDGKPYFPVGEDMCWPFAFWGARRHRMRRCWTRKTTSYEPYSYGYWLPKLRAGGGNWVRIWMSWPGNFGLE